MGNFNDTNEVEIEPFSGSWELQHGNTILFEWETPSFVPLHMGGFPPVYQLDRSGQLKIIANTGKTFTYSFDKDKSKVLNLIEEISLQYPPERVVSEMRRHFINWTLEHERMLRDIHETAQRLEREGLL
jgi:hypothetical protein